ncbi:MULTISPECIES: hypothetical protein, partial [unclassified Lactonifactor]|uniref:hypothetical protein n=1 Tax=unclassified Lactonifactor TaxID=2636670 RepID=UPI0019D60E75
YPLFQVICTKIRRFTRRLYGRCIGSPPIKPLLVLLLAPLVPAPAATMHTLHPVKLAGPAPLSYTR